METLKLQSRCIKKTHRPFGTRALLDMRGLSMAQRHGFSSCSGGCIFRMHPSRLCDTLGTEAHFTRNCAIAETQCSPGPSERCQCEPSKRQFRLQTKASKIAQPLNLIAMTWVGGWRWLVRSENRYDAHVGPADTCPSNHSGLENHNLRFHESTSTTLERSRTIDTNRQTTGEIELALSAVPKYISKAA